MRIFILVITILICFSHSGKAQCDFYGAITGLSVSGATAGDNTQEYVLVSVYTGNILSVGSTPDFSALSPGDYQVYAINYEGLRPSEVTVGQPWSGTGAISTCFDASAPYNATVCNTNTPCEFINDITGLSVSGATAGDNTQEYVLVSGETGNILEINPTPDFMGLNGGNYLIYGINYEGIRPTEIAVGQPWSATVAIASCFDATAPYSTNVCEDFCENEPLVVSTSGFTTTGAFSQTYILVDISLDEVIGLNNTGTFDASLLSANDQLEIYALNTDDATLLATISDGVTWSAIESDIPNYCADLLGPRSIIILSSTDGACCDTTVKGFLR